MSRTTLLNLGSISWIHQQLTPVHFLSDAKIFQPTWVPKTYLGIFATRNPSPAGVIDLPAYQPSKLFRAMTYASLEVTTSDDGSVVESVRSAKSIIDPGWTPPFNRNITILTRFYVPEPSMKDLDFHAGQLGAGSAILLRKRHPNTTISTSFPLDRIVASGMVIFRAGKVTDDVGVDVVKCPYHVPWVWCEWLLVCDKGGFRMYATGSIFPTHNFYLNGVSYAQQDEPTDARFVTGWTSPLTIDTNALRVYPVLTVGAPASGPQAVDTTRVAVGPITTQAFVVKGSGQTSTGTAMA
jgi:hypothetical protein